MSNMDKRLRRLEGPEMCSEEVPAWCVASARQETELGLIDASEEAARAESIARKFRNSEAYKEHMQRQQLAFITMEAC